jgi:iron complex outermembrane recepter protein
MKGRFGCTMKSTIASAIALMVLVWSSPMAQAQAKAAFDLPAQPLADSLRAVGSQTNINLLFDPPLVAGKKAPALKAEVTADEALTRLLVGTGIKHEFLNETTIVLAKADAVGSKSSRGGASPNAASEVPGDDPKEGNKRGANSFRVAQVDQGIAGPQAVGNSDDQNSERRKKDELTEIVVTGTHIHGAQDSSSPMTTITREDIERSGVSSTADLVRLIPQNFGGGVTNVTTGASTYAGAESLSNFTNGSGINLRGLGNDSTLVLVDGHRLASAGIGSFVDISLIPLAAIDRVEVLTDGASAIYGSDAVGGVVNIILRKNYEGVESRVRYGSVTDGRHDELQVGQTVGHEWSTGSALATYEYAGTSPLPSTDRSFATGLAPTNLQPPQAADLLPRTHSNSFLGSISQSVGADTELFAEGMFSKRGNEENISLLAPGFPTASGSQSAEQYGATVGATTKWGSDWHSDIAATYNKSISEQNLIDSGTSFNSFDSQADEWTIDGSGDGTIFDGPGGKTSLAVGGQYRKERYNSSGTQDPIAAQASRSIAAGFGELLIPIVGKTNAIAGVSKLDLAIAARFERYSDFGSTTNGKVGLSWSPVAEFTVRGTYGTSFRAPLLSELDNSPPNQNNFALPFPNAAGGTTNAIFISTGNPGLGPQKARTWTVGTDFVPEAIANFRASATYFNIVFRDRIAPPIPLIAYQTSLTDPNYSSFVNFNPSLAQVNQLYANPFFQSFGIAPAQIAAIINDQLTNIAERVEDGVDLSLSYKTDTPLGRFDFNATGTYIANLKDKPASTSAFVPLVNTIFNPIDFRMRDGITWSRNGLSLSGFINYADRYRNNTVTPTASIASWTTVDLSLRYDTGRNARLGLMKGVSISVSALNVLDRNPPFVSGSLENDNVVNFDSANASPLNRFVSVEFQKAW